MDDFKPAIPKVGNRVAILINNKSILGLDIPIRCVEIKGDDFYFEGYSFLSRLAFNRFDEDSELEAYNSDQNEKYFVLSKLQAENTIREWNKPDNTNVPLKSKHNTEKSYREHTLQEIADHIGVTRERVRQIEHSIFQKLRHPKYRKYWEKIIYLTEEISKKRNLQYHCDTLKEIKLAYAKNPCWDE